MERDTDFRTNQGKEPVQKCGREDQLEVRHLTYTRLYNELLNDLEVLCDKCQHEQSDKRWGGHYADLDFQYE